MTNTIRLATRLSATEAAPPTALRPAALVLHQTFGIEYGLMNTTHAYTNSQVLLDQPEKDLRGARAAALSIVPYSSGAAKALGKVIPELNGRLTGYSLRVPVPVVSIVDLTVTLKREVTVAEVNAAFRKAAESGPLKAFSATAKSPWYRATIEEIRVRPLLMGFPPWSSVAGWSRSSHGTTTNGAFPTASLIWRF
jgi:glyceraldehyde-3-phosphate dehydrogenase/erythrose-4-phosphate dehydrogenase